MWNDTTWVAGLATTVLLYYGLRGWYANWQHDRLEAMQNLSFQYYVATGKKTQAFDTLSRRAIKAAERERRDCVKTREKEESVFQAECHCPQCNSFAVHWLINRDKRQCKECGHEWKQS